MAIASSAYNALMGMFSPKNPQNVSGSIYDLARQDAQRQQMMQIGGGLMAAAVPQTPLMRAQALQGAFGGMGDVGTGIYNAAQARLMSQRAEMESREANRNANIVSALSGGNAPKTAPVASAPPADMDVKPLPAQAYQTSTQTKIPFNLTPSQHQTLMAMVNADYPNATIVDEMQKMMVANAKPPKSDWSAPTVENGMYIQRNELTGEVKATPLPSDKGNEAYDKAVGQAQFDFETNTANAYRDLQNVNMLGTLLEGADTGAGTTAKNFATKFATFFGLNDEQLKSLGLNRGESINIDTARSLINLQAMSMIGPGGLPAQNFSNADLQFVLNSQQSISNLPEANRVLTAIQRGKAEARIAAGKAWREYKKEKGKDADFMQWQSEYQSYLNGNNISFMDEAKQVLQESLAEVEAGGAGTQPTDNTEPAQLTPVTSGGVQEGSVIVDNREGSPTRGQKFIIRGGKMVPYSGGM